MHVNSCFSKVTLSSSFVQTTSPNRTGYLAGTLLGEAASPWSPEAAVSKIFMLVLSAAAEDFTGASRSRRILTHHWKRRQWVNALRFRTAFPRYGGQSAYSEFTTCDVISPKNSLQGDP